MDSTLSQTIPAGAGQQPARPHLSVVIPVYKAERTLRPLYERLKTSLEQVSSAFEIVLVEDCGGDRSWAIIQELAEEDPRVVGLQFSRNFGQHYGITAGLDHARGDWVFVMDCDLQDPPEYIPVLYAKAQEGYDVVLARRQNRKDNVLKRGTSWAFYQVFNYLSGMRHDASVGNYRIISRKVADAFREMRENLRFFSGLVDWMGFPTAAIDIEAEERHDGKSTYTVRKLLKLANETIIAYSDKPLHLAVNLGFLIALASFAGGLYLIYRALFFHIPVEGWASLIVSLYFLGGIIIAILGVIGIYLGKTFNEAKKRPLYIIREKTHD
jgi:dolichol-phosphate mannosyltransferase